jgi:hypothetical protein
MYLKICVVFFKERFIQIETLSFDGNESHSFTTTKNNIYVMEYEGDAHDANNNGNSQK